MRQFSRIPIIYFFLFLLSIMSCNENKTEDNGKGEDLSSVKNPYKKGEIVIAYEDVTMNENKKLVENIIKSKFPSAEKKECSSCLQMTELWRAPGIEEFISDILDQLIDAHGDIKKSTPVTIAGATGDNEIMISLNYEYQINQRDSSNVNSDFDHSQYPVREDLTVAILDSGVDTSHFPDSFLKQINDQKDCYSNSKFGWNFIEDNGNQDYHDDTRSKHGTLVNLYILEEIITGSGYIPRFLNVKVLDEENKGTLFSLLCGLHFAKQQGAHIVNTSLGFYDERDFAGFRYEKHPIMTYLTREFLEGHQMLIVTAAGNVVNGESDERNLDKNPFYPAVLSHLEEKSYSNFLTITTSDKQGKKVSDRQNYSNKYVDAAIRSDVENAYSFTLPFAPEESTPQLVSGSSYAAAIMTGKIASHWDNIPRGLNYRIVDKSAWIPNVLPPHDLTASELIPLNEEVKGGISYIRLNNRSGM